VQCGGFAETLSQETMPPVANRCANRRPVPRGLPRSRARARRMKPATAKRVAKLRAVPAVAAATEDAVAIAIGAAECASVEPIPLKTRRLAPSRQSAGRTHRSLRASFWDPQVRRHAAGRLRRRPGVLVRPASRTSPALVTAASCLAGCAARAAARPRRARPRSRNAPARRAGTSSRLGTAPG
jgi:hypothetical protein